MSNQPKMTATQPFRQVATVDNLTGGALGSTIQTAACRRGIDSGI